MTAASATRSLSLLRRVSRLLPVLALLLLAFPGFALGAGGGTGPLLWTAPMGVDSSPINGLSCLPAGPCVGVDHAGRVLWSADPTAGLRDWQTADVDGSADLTGISCPAVSLCVAVDAPGNVVTSTNPTGGRDAWTAARIDTNHTVSNTDNAGSILLRGVSCPGPSLCVAVDSVGDSLTSTNPTGGPAFWTDVHIDSNRTKNCGGGALACQPPLTGISCPSLSECAAVDFAGHVLTTRNPVTPLAPWSSTATDNGDLSSLYGVSCPVVGFCATVDGIAGKAITFNPARAYRQVTRSLPYSLYGIWCASRSLCLASVETSGGISGLLGSFDPASPRSSWRLSSLGGVNAVSCPRSYLCLAADDEGNIAAGVTTRSVRSELAHALLNRRRLPSRAQLGLGGRVRLPVTSAIAARISLTWTYAVHGRTVVAAAARRSFAAPGTRNLVLHINARGRALLRSAARSVRVVASATYTASTGSVGASGKLVFRR